MTPGRQLALIHAGLTLLLMLALGLPVGCVSVEEEKPKLGPEVSREEVVAEIEKALEPLDPFRSRVGDFAQYEFNVRLGSGPVEKTEESLYEIMRSELIEDFTRFYIHITQVRWVNSKPEVSKSEDYFDLSNLKSMMARTEKWSPRAEESSTFHRLQVFDEERNPPQAVMAQSDCGGLEDCKINVRRITFDQVIWGCAKPKSCPRDYRVIQNLQEYSSDIPFVGPYFEGGVLNHCQTGFVTVEVDGRNKKYLARLCNVLRNFHLGPTSN